MIAFTRRTAAIAATAGPATGMLVAGAPAIADEPAPPPVCADEADLTLVSEIQGPGDSTPLGGATVTIEGVVVGDYQGPFPALRGLYVQEADVDADGDALTSEGVFVFAGNNRIDELGDVVRITGTVADFQGQTQLSSLTCWILDVDTTAPAGLADGDVVVVDEDSLRLRATPDGRAYLIDVLANASGQSSFGPVEIPVLTRPPGRS